MKFQIIEDTSSQLLLQYETYSQHGQQILATLSQRLTERFGKTVMRK